MVVQSNIVLRLRVPLLRGAVEHDGHVPRVLPVPIPPLPSPEPLPRPHFLRVRPRAPARPCCAPGWGHVLLTELAVSFTHAIARPSIRVQSCLPLESVAASFFLANFPVGMVRAPFMLNLGTFSPGLGDNYKF